MKTFLILAFACLVWALVAPFMLWLACMCMGLNVGFFQAFGAVVAVRVLSAVATGDDRPEALKK